MARVPVMKMALIPTKPKPIAPTAPPLHNLRNRARGGGEGGSGGRKGSSARERNRNRPKGGKIRSKNNSRAPITQVHTE